LWMFALLPEPILIPLFRRWAADPKMDIALVRHANAARDEVQHLTDEFLEIARTTHVPTPTIERLYPHLDPETPLMPDGSRDISLDWRGVWIGVGALAGVVTAGVWLLKRLKPSTD